VFFFKNGGCGDFQVVAVYSLAVCPDDSLIISCPGSGMGQAFAQLVGAAEIPIKQNPKKYKP
jgi:hypothetical protein